MAALRQYVWGDSGTGNPTAASFSLNFTKATLPGSLLFAIATCGETSGATVKSVSDPVNSNWIQASAPLIDPGNQSMGAFYLPNAQALTTAQSVTSTPTIAASFQAIFMGEIVGADPRPNMVLTTTMNDVIAAGAGTNNVSSGLVQMKQYPTLAIGLSFNWTGANSPNVPLPNTAWQSLGTGWQWNDGQVSTAAEMQTFAAPGIQQALFSAQGADHFGTYILGFLSADSLMGQVLT